MRLSAKPAHGFESHPFRHGKPPQKGGFFVAEKMVAHQLYLENAPIRGDFGNKYKFILSF